MIERLSSVPYFISFYGCVNKLTPRAPAAGRACGHFGLTGPKSRYPCAWQSGYSGTQLMLAEDPRQAKGRLSFSP